MSSALRIRRGLFDRLLATDPDAPEGLIQTCSVEQLRDTVARDLERLLNARSALLSTQADPSALGPQARSSVMCFGVPDFAGRVLASSEDQRFIASSLAKAIEAHEPRLKQVAVDFRQDAGIGDRGQDELLAFSHGRLPSSDRSVGRRAARTGRLARRHCRDCRSHSGRPADDGRDRRTRYGCG